MIKEILIRNGNIVTAEKEFHGDILIENDRIIDIKNSLTEISEDTEIIDASGKYVIPGGIDPHVHLDLPTPAGNSSDDFYSGSIAAIYGGTTSFIDFVTPSKNESLVSALKDRMKFSEKSLLDYSFHMSITSWSPETAREMERIVKEYGITSFKTYLAYKGTIGIEEAELSQVMKTAARLKALVSVHCEMGDEIVAKQKEFIAAGKTSPKYHALSRPSHCESESVKHVISLAARAKCPVYIVHTSAAESLDAIEAAQKAGQEVYSETCPQYLLLDDSVYDLPLQESLRYVISPPLRKKEDREKLWKGIEKGSVSVIATDHCPFNTKGQKDAGMHDFTKIPNGGGGIEYRLPLLFTFGVLKKRISMPQFVSLSSAGAARIFGLRNKGVIKKGAAADMVIWDPSTENTITAKKHHQKCDSNIFEGFKIQGQAETVFINGKKVLENTVLLHHDLKGTFIPRSHFP